MILVRYFADLLWRSELLEKLAKRKKALEKYEKAKRKASIAAEEKAQEKMTVTQQCKDKVARDNKRFKNEMKVKEERVKTNLEQAR